jgi:hypothetical protein
MIFDDSGLNYADFYILSARTTHRKHSYSIVAKACLPRRFLAIEAPLLRGADHIENTAILLRVGACLRSRCLAMRHNNVLTGNPSFA